MALDPFANQSDSATSGARRPFAVVPNDTTELALIPKALYVGGGGSVTVRGVDATTDVVFRNVPAGAVIDVRAQYVRATGTSATDIVALA